MNPSHPGYLIEDGETVGFGCDTFHVRKIDRKLANDIIRNRHYSGTIYNGSYIHLGVYVGEELLGVLQFGVAMNPASMASVVADTKKDEYLELNRMWLDDALPKNSESRALSYAIKYIKRVLPKIGWIQSFADERCRRLGVVYQAANFLYCGEHTSTFWVLDGVWYHNSLMTRNPDLTPKARHVQANRDRAVPHKFRQFRYIYFIKPKLQAKLKKSTRPYPKPALEVSMETRPGTTGEG